LKEQDQKKRALIVKEAKQAKNNESEENNSPKE
jgi:hypothetical protein